MLSVTPSYECALHCTWRPRFSCMLSSLLEATRAKKFRTLFLLERVRIVRSPFIERKRDPIWIGGTIATICGYLGITAFEFIQPESEFSRVDSLCRIGIQPNAAIGVIVLDTVFNVVLTMIFIQQLRPAVGSAAHRSMSDARSGDRHRRSPSISRLLSLEESGLGGSSRTSAENSLRAMLFRNLAGSVLLLLNTVVPNVIFLTWGFARWSHTCQLMCLTDSKSCSAC